MISGQSSKIELIRTYSSLSLKKVVDYKFPSIGTLCRTSGSDMVRTATGVILADLSSSFRGELSTDEIEELIEEVHGGLLRNITLEGLWLCCRQLKGSEVRGKLSVNKVLTALNKHLDDVTDLHEIKSKNDHLQHSYHFERSNNESAKNAEAIKWYLQNK